MEETETLTMTLNEWYPNPKIKSFFLRCYYVIGIEEEDLPTRIKDFDLNGVHVIFLHGRMNYSKDLPITVENNEIKIEYNESELISSTKTGNYLLLLSPWDIEGEEESEMLSEHRISIASSLLAVFNGRNIIYEHVFDNVVMGNRFLPKPKPILTPLWNKKPNLSEERLGAISKASDIIYKLPENDKNRVELSLKWFLSAICDNGVNAYLKYWIACEIIGMPNETDISPLKKIIKEAYDVDDEKVNDFKIGNLYGLRSAIVHNGEIIPIHGQLLKYIESLYIDVLFEKLKLPTERKAEKALRDTNLRFEEYYPKTRKKNV